MKKSLILNWALFFSLIILIILHVLSLFSIIPAEILWDKNIGDYQYLFVSDIIILLILMVTTTIMRNFLTDFKRGSSRKSQKHLLIAIIVFSILEMLSASLGTYALYKLFTLITYIYILTLSIFCYCSIKTRVRKYKNKFNKNEIILP